MGAVTGLDTNQTAFQFCEELQHLSSAKFPLHNGLAMTIDAMNLKHVLCDIQTNGKCRH
ncbi:hypothetical protein OKW38_006232 [Paraburkholderia sp. MM5496-R1]|uniref:hypothetical protein n=1 Tax=Paraburkholderia sp. MM6662-R1 TaxID=2991066 RepID=UPI003D25F372